MLSHVLLLFFCFVYSPNFFLLWPIRHHFFFITLSSFFIEAILIFSLSAGYALVNKHQMLSGRKSYIFNSTVR